MRVNHERAGAGGEANSFTCDGQLAELSRHRSSEGMVRYLRCTCGAWLIVLGGPEAGVRVAQVNRDAADHLQNWISTWGLPS